MGADVRSLDIADVKLIKPPKLADHPGSCPRRTFAAAGIDIDFRQDSHSPSTEKGTVCGLHFQTPPFAQDKLMCVAT
jgi:dTDP-4-dehydrorhamnose 3,5-epimerase